MDVRDSSSSLTAAVNRDGSSSAVEEDGALSVTTALAKEATSLFQLGKYAECVDVLNQLNQKKQDDPKVLHNVAIAEYFRDGCSVPNRLLDVLNKVKKRSEELAQASGVQVEAVVNLGNKLLPKGNNAVDNHNSSANSTSFVYMNEFETSIATLNNAIIWFSLYEYTKALSVLEPLYQNIEPINEITALHVCFLLLDLGLACNNASKCADVLLYMEKAFGFSGTNQSDSGSLAQQDSGNLSSVFNADSSNSDLGSGINASEDPFARTLSDETLEYESVSTLDIGGQNLSRPRVSATDDLSRNAVSRFMSNIDLKLKLQLYKVRFLLLTWNLKQAKREAKQVMNIARSRDSFTALLLKAQLEYARGNYRKAVKLLVASSNQTDIRILSMFNNNLGCIYYQLGNYHTASLFFSRALSNSSTTQCKDKPLKLSTLSKDNSFLITYNCGVQYLACGKPLLAARCFQKASVIFYNRPLVWIRLAECCLMALEKGLLETKHAEPSRTELRFHVIGKGKWRHLVFEDSVVTNGHGNSTGKDNGFLDGDRRLKVSMSLAQQCLFNALYLMNDSEVSFSTSGLSSNSTMGENEAGEALASKNSNLKNLHSIDPKGSSVIGGSNQVNSNGDTKEQRGVTVQELVQNSLPCYEDISRREKLLTKQALLANLAFVELELENPLKALTFAKSLLDLPECSRVYIFLGHVYAAEALCLLNRLKEAAEHLLAYLTQGKDFGLPFSQEDRSQWQTDRSVESKELNGGGSVTGDNTSSEDPPNLVFLKPEEARAVLYANFAAISAVQGELEQAQQFATEALSIIPNSRQATLTAIYVDLMMGKSQEAIAKLKQCSCLRLISNGLKLSKS